MPFTNAPESSPENFLAKSTASFRTTLGGVSEERSSCMARRRMARSMAARRSKRQFSACLTMISSSTVTSFAAPSNKRLANSRVVSAALAARQNFASSLAGSCWLMSHWKSICMANSRDLLRRDILLVPRLSGGGSFCRGGGRFSARELSREVRHFDGGQACFKTLVAALEAGAVDGLLEGVAGEHAKNNGEAGVHLRELQTARGFRANVIVMRGFASENAANGDERIVAAGSGEFFCCEGKFEGAGYMDDVDVFALSICATQSINGRS